MCSLMRLHTAGRSRHWKFDWNHQFVFETGELTYEFVHSVSHDRIWNMLVLCVLIV